MKLYASEDDILKSTVKQHHRHHQGMHFQIFSEFIIIPSDPITLQLSEHSGAYLLHRAPNVQWSQRALTTPWS